ncbi:signal transduction histidine kinase [Solirubrobacter pauli]|uniref:histidine kinase n=1 Tax=Solirubrobacter pauli TaxID=166793 RepID=A0A660LI80_9ACTN|nr:histidine kinase [Solirubrobacter pauli]RKQ93995.1 signal transduction histidine kinase [Solirubrobacter pauli]
MLAPWRSVAYLAARLPLPAVGALLVLLTAGGGWTIALAVPILLAYLTAATFAAPFERRLVTILDRPPIPPARPQLKTVAHAAIGLVAAPFECLFLAGWSLGGLALVLSPALLGEGPVAAGVVTVDTAAEAWIAVPVGIVILAVGTYATVGLATVHAFLARELLSPTDGELQHQVTELTSSRLRLIDAFDVERRRIERDLHDGAQQQLVNLAMTLDLARIELEGSDTEAERLVDQAHRQATSTMRELRDLIHGIHPPVLADRGLPGAIEALADRSPLPIHHTTALPHRLPESIETTAYFVLAEALANAAKHSRAEQVELSVQLEDRTLTLEVSDDGRGGARPKSGLAGLGDRVAAVGGRLTLSSPTGGPTIIRAEIPCP